MNTMSTSPWAGRARWLSPVGCFVLLSFLLMAPAHATTPAWQDHDTIRAAADAAARASAAQAFAGPDVKISASAEALDPRLRLRPCPAPLDASPRGQRPLGRVTVEVNCPAGPRWRLYVPVQVTVVRPVVVAARSLARDTVLAPGDVTLTERDVSGLPYGFLPDAGLAVGQRLRRDVGQGDLLTPAMVAAPVLVRRGQPVTVEALGSGIRVGASGIAQADGALGDVIPVKNSRSGKVVRGAVRSADTVVIALR